MTKHNMPIFRVGPFYKYKTALKQQLKLLTSEM